MTEHSPRHAVPIDYGTTPAYRFATVVLPPLLRASMKRDWRGGEFLPQDRGFVAAANHVTLIDPLVLAYFLWGNGAPPFFLAKDALFSVAGFGKVLRNAEQIPVYRGSSAAGNALRAAIAAVEEGRCVVVYPEGTTTKDPARWPMEGKSGAARIGLATGCPVIPIGQWGSHEILARGKVVPRLVPRQLVRVQAGPPVDFSDLVAGMPAQEAATSVPVLRAATERITRRITELVAGLRGEEPPAQPFRPAR